MANLLSKKEIDLYNSRNCIVFKKVDNEWIPQNHPPKLSQKDIDGIDKTTFDNSTVSSPYTIYHTISI